MNRHSEKSCVVKSLVGAVLGTARLGTLRARVRLLLWFGILSPFASLVHAVDVTGAYIEAKPTKCDKKLRESGIGSTYLAACFRGDAAIETGKLEIVQNGSRVCGRYWECAGFNCNRLYEGRVVGTVEKDILTLYREDGHVGADKAPGQRFRVRLPYLVDRPKAGAKGAAQYRRMAVDLKRPELKGQCEPMLSGAVTIEDSEFRVSGKPLVGFPLDSIEIVEPVRALRKPPAPRLLVVKPGQDRINYQDFRTDDNWVLRTVRIVNESAETVDVTIREEGDCGDFLREQRRRFKQSQSENQDKRVRGASSGWPEDFSIAAGAQTSVKTCHGMGFTLDRRGA